jgi:thioredoxin family protein
MSVEWITDADEALNTAKAQNKPLLIDFSAAPAWGACARLEAESYGDAGLASYIEGNFVPLHVHIKDNPKNFHRFEAVWTPTVMVMDPDGHERWRLEGYLPKEEFQTYLELGLARVAFMKKDWSAAEHHFSTVLDQHPNSKFVPVAVYYKGVSRYSASHDGGELAQTAATLSEKFPGNEWQLRSQPWLREKSESTTG